jgi:cytochrome c-type biogenesis protein CcmH/NrfG
MNVRRFLIPCLFLAFFSFSGFAQTADALIDSAWQAWNRNDQAAVERYFLAAQKEDPYSLRASIGLYYLYSMQQKYEASAHQIIRALPFARDQDPYVYAAWQILIFRTQNFSDRKPVIDLFKRLANTPSTNSSLKAMSNAALGDYYESLNNFPLSKKYYDEQNAVGQWKLIGPFENISASGFERAFPPEGAFDAQAVCTGKNGIPISWFPQKSTQRNGWIDLTHYFANQFSVFYANTFLYSPVRRTVRFYVGTSGSLKAFLNDNLVLQNADEYNNDLDTYCTQTELQQGWNRVLLKVGYSEISRCNFMVRVLDTLGRPIPDLRVSIDEHPCPSRPSAVGEQQELFAEKYFRRMIEEHPECMENYLLLADVYLHNDKAIPAELLLRTALRKLPSCGVILLRQIEAYSRGQKSDEITKMFERLLTLDPKIPDALEYRFARAMQNEDYDEAATTIDALESFMPNSDLTLNAKLQLYSKKQQMEKLLAVAGAASARYPNNWNFVRLDAALTLQRTRNTDSAIAVIDRYLKRVYSKDALKDLAALFMQASKKEKWEQAYLKILQLDPSGANERLEMASVYLDMRDFKKATRSIKEALDICPTSSLLWGKLAEIQFARNMKEAADSSCRRALQCDPGNFRARDLMRECEGKESVFKNFPQEDIKQMMQAAPSSLSYPNDPAIVLLDDNRRVLYEQGAAEYEHEMLIRVFNNRGIDMMKEYGIEYNGSEELIVEKAVVIKKSGYEIKADVEDGHLVFKTLEPDDFVYMKWRLRQTGINMITTMFNDNILFNGRLPLKLVRYSVLVPSGFSFSHRTFNMEDHPVVQKKEEGDLYEWSSTQEPALNVEPAMPPLSQVGKVLSISTIPSWKSVVDWYEDLASTRTKSSFEIQEQTAELFKGKKDWTTQEKIRKIYEFIVTNIRYSSVPFRQSGIIPQKARDVLVNRIGDCKDVATLGIAMLKEVGIPAFHVLTRIRSMGSNPNELPSIGFDHCIVGVQTETGIQYSDLTAQFHPYGCVPGEDHGAFCLLIKPGETEPFLQDPKQWLPSNITRTYHAVLGADNSISIDQVSRYTGALSAGSRAPYAEKGEAEQQKQLSNYLAEDFANAKLKKLSFENLNNLEPAFELHYSYDVPNYLTEIGSLKAMKLPWGGEYPQSTLSALEKRRYPLRAWFGTDTLIERADIEFPDGTKPLELIPEAKFSCSAADYTETLLFNGKILQAERKIVFKKRDIPVEEYPEFRAFMNRLTKEDGKQILIGKK